VIILVEKLILNCIAIKIEAVNYDLVVNLSNISGRIIPDKNDLNWTTRKQLNFDEIF